MEKLIEADLVYDLSGYLEKYCPNMVAMAERSQLNYLASKREDGEIYALPYEIMSYEYVAPEFEIDVLIQAEVPSSPYGYVYVRDDILKKIYPNAKTQQEFEDIFMKNGGFTREEMMDIPINNPEEFFDFLYKIKELGIKEGNREVYSTFVADGLDNRATFEQNVNNGLYAVIYGATSVPDPNKLNANLKAQGKNYQYRKVYLNILLNHDKFLFPEGGVSGQSVVILKANIKEEDGERRFVIRT